MGVINEQYTRGGKTKNLELGIDAEGESHCRAETVLPQEPYNLPVRESVVDIHIKLDRKQLTGRLESIRIERGQGFLSPNGQVIEDTITTLPFLSKEQDKKDFCRMYGEGILRSVINGIVEILEGFEGKKVFDPQTGALLTYTPEEEAEPAPGAIPPPEPVVTP